MGFRPIEPAPAQKGGAVKFRPISTVTKTAQPKFRPVSGLTFQTTSPAPAKVQPQQSGGFWRGLGNQLIKPGASASNLLEDTGKTIAAAGVSAFTPHNFADVKKKMGVDFIQHQADVFKGDNKRTFSTIMNEITDENPNKVQKFMGKTLGYGADFILDPLNKVKILAATQKGNEALKTGRMALSAAEQAKKGQRALLQIGNMNILPSVGNRVLAASTKANDAIRGTKYGAMGADMLSKVSTSIRPGGVSRPEFKILRDATVAGKNVQNYTKDKAIQFAVSIEKSLRDKGAKPEVRSALLHAIEKGDKKLAPQGFDDVFEAGMKFKGENETAWKALGGSTLDNYGLAHVATDEVAEAASKKNRGSVFSGNWKPFSSDTPQDIHRQWAKVGEQVPQARQAVPESPLLQEAKKYKSAEEFGASLKYKKGGTSLFHGTDNIEGILQEGKIKPYIERDFRDIGRQPTVKGIIEGTPQVAGKTFPLTKNISLSQNPKQSGKFGDFLFEFDRKKTPSMKDVREVRSSVVKGGKAGRDELEWRTTNELPISEAKTAYMWDTGDEVADMAMAKRLEDAGVKDVRIMTLGGLDKPSHVIYSTKTGKLTDLYNKAQGGAGVAKVEGKIVNLENEGIHYVDNVYEKGKGAFVDKSGKVVNVTQATAKEINESLVGAGKSPIFKEDLPTVVARMGISTGKKQAGVEFLEATKGLKGKAKELANEAYEKITNVESVAKAIKHFDTVQNLWKAQVLVAPSYHIRNEVGNLWNNFLADVGPGAYVKSSALQGRILKGTLTKADEVLIEQMKKQGVIGTGQYGGDITQSIADELGGASINPLSQRFGLYKGNRAVGSAIEDNAKIAHYLQKIGDGFTPKAAAESVKKYLFDYGDLTWGEQNILKRVMPFYTWTRKNLPLQVEQFFNKPGKFSNVATLQRDIESGVEQPEERYLNDFIKTNTPMRISTNEDGTTSYLLLGQWLPAAAAVQLLTQNPKQMLNMISPVYKVPKDFINNQSFFKNSLGEDQPIEKYPEEMKSFLGMDMGAKTANILRNIRVLSELDKLNPGGVFGGKDSPSMIPGGSQNRGAKQTPDAPALARWRDFIVGKTQTYDPENSKGYYDRDTEDRMGEYTRALDQAMEFKNPEQAKQIIKLMEEFQSERAGGKNKVLDQYNLMGDRYLQDRYKDRQAEFDRKDAREKMKELIRKAVETNDANLLQEALRLDPSYAKDAIKDAMKEKQESGYSTDIKKQLYEVERMKTEKRLNPFYTK